MLGGLLVSLFLAAILAAHPTLPTVPLIASIVLFAVGGWVAAWSWWSWQVPKWRIWALRNVTDWLELKRRAVEDKLIWPDGHFFEKTEIKSAEQREVEAELRRIRESEG